MAGKAFVFDGSSTNIAKYAAVVLDTSSAQAGKLPTAANVKALGFIDQPVTLVDERASVSMAACDSFARASGSVTRGDRLNIADTSGNVKKAQSTLTTALTGTNNDLVWSAASAWLGEKGDLITIEYRDPSANSASLSIVVEGTAIIVNLATDGSGVITSTGDTIKTALAAHGVAAAMVSAVDATDNDGSGVVTAMTATRLSGGANDFCEALESASSGGIFRVWLD